MAETRSNSSLLSCRFRGVVTLSQLADPGQSSASRNSKELDVIEFLHSFELVRPNGFVLDGKKELELEYTSSSVPVESVSC